MRFVLLFCFSFSLAIRVFAQQASTTSLVGRVTDTSGATIPNASVTAVEDGTKVTYAGKTNDLGAYVFDLVRIGTYTITASAEGFGTVIRKGVVVDINQVVRTNFELPVGQTSERVTVAAALAPLATDDAAVSEVLNEKTVSDIPLNGRDVLRMAALTPGVITGMKNRTGSGASGGEDFIGAGSREIQNSISLDGVSIVSNLVTTTTLRPSVDATQEVQIQTGTYSAQYGNMLGVHLNVITKSGSNDLHGTGWEFVRNNYFDARDFFAPPAAAQPFYHQNQFGGELGGPVWLPKLYNGRNKTFFLVEYEGVRQSSVQSSLAAMFPAAYRSGNLSAVKTTIKDPLNGFAPIPGNIIPANELSPQAQKALAFMPLPNIPGASANNYQASAGIGNTTDQTLDRIDQNIGDKTRFFFRLAWQNSSLLQGQSNPFNGTSVPLTDRNYAFGYTQTINPHAVNDFRFGYEIPQYESIDFFTGANAAPQLGIPGYQNGPQDPGIPEFVISGYVAIGGQNMASANWVRPDSTYEWTDVLNYTAGAHAISAGAEFFRLTTGSHGNNYQRGLFNFTGDITGSAAADFLLGLPLNDTTPGTPVLVLARQWRNAFFVSDKWDISRKLTLTLGLRYELPTAARSPNGTIDFLNPAGTALIPSPPASVSLTDPQHNAIAPRLGFAYRLSDRWVVRGGGGLYYNGNQMNTYTLGGGNPPFSSRTTYNSPPTSPTLSLANPSAGSVGAAPPGNVNTFPAYLPMAMMGQWSLDVERTLWGGAGLDVQYLGSDTDHLDRNYYSNTPIPGPGPVQARRPNQLFGVIRVVANDAVANYDALNVIMRQRLNRGVSLLLSYTWSHTLDVCTDSNNSGATMDPFNWKADYGNSNWDIRHRLVASYSYILPFFQKGWKRYPLGGWQINGVTTLQSGTPITLSIPGDPANTGAPVPERPNAIAPATANCGGGHLSGCIPAASFAMPSLYTYGNAGRNTLKGPGLVSTDLSLFKNFDLGTERAKLQLRLEGFNIFNTPSFSNPSGVFGTGAFGSVTSTLFPNRQIQLAAKIIF